jgi:hypothetical protein
MVKYVFLVNLSSLNVAEMSSVHVKTGTRGQNRVQLHLYTSGESFGATVSTERISRCPRVSSVDARGRSCASA